MLRRAVFVDPYNFYLNKSNGAEFLNSSRLRSQSQDLFKRFRYPAERTCSLPQLSVYFARCSSASNSYTSKIHENTQCLLPHFVFYMPRDTAQRPFTRLSCLSILHQKNTGSLSVTLLAPFGELLESEVLRRLRSAEKSGVRTRNIFTAAIIFELSQLPIVKNGVSHQIGARDNTLPWL